MKLKQWPVAEADYWRAIEELGGIIWHVEHDISHGRIDLAPEIEIELSEARRISTQLVDELFVRFGVIKPADCPKVEFGEKMPKAPFGMKWYWDWYHEMKREICSAEYGQTICSVCLFSKGLDDYVSRNHVPCGLFEGILYRIPAPGRCAMIRDYGGEYSRTDFLEMIREKFGQEAVEAFLEKEAALNAA